jgi:hypothetical protein
MTIILKGGYWEHTPQGRFWRGPGTIKLASCDALHRVELDPNVAETWTLAIGITIHMEKIEEIGLLELVSENPFH